MSDCGKLRCRQQPTEEEIDVSLSHFALLDGAFRVKPLIEPIDHAEQGESSDARREPRGARVSKFVKWLFNPPPSNLIFYVLIASNIWFAFQVEMQGKIIKTQMILLDYFVRVAFQR